MAAYPESFASTTPANPDRASRDAEENGNGEPIRLLKIARLKSLLNGNEAMIVVRQLSKNFARFDAYLPLLIGESVEIDFDDTGALRGIIITYSSGRKIQLILLRIGSSALKRKSISIRAMLIDRQTISLTKAGTPCLKRGGALCCNSLIDA